MGKLIHTLFFSLLVAQAGAQSATNFDTKVVSPVMPGIGETPSPDKPTNKQAPPATGTPSRYIGQDQMESYVETTAAVFLMRGQETDPFGLIQDPNIKPLVKTSPTSTRPVIIPATPFPEIIRLIQVNTVVLGEQSFLINSRMVKKGEVLPIHFRGKEIRAQVIEVSARKISFKNLDTGEVASREMDMLPVGMTPGTKGIAAPGVSPNQPAAPIVLDPDETPSN